jgi:anti-sigma factor RsiW
MNERTPPEARPVRGDDEAFVIQVLRYLDGLATVQDLSELKEALATRRECRALFVRLCRLHGELGELLAPQRAAATETAEAPHPARLASPRGDTESPPGAAAHPAKADASSAVSVADTAGGPDRTPTGDPPGTVRPPEDTTEYIEDSEGETMY